MRELGSNSTRSACNRPPPIRARTEPVPTKRCNWLSNSWRSALISSSKGGGGTAAAGVFGPGAAGLGAGGPAAGGPTAGGPTAGGTAAGGPLRGAGVPVGSGWGARAWAISRSTGVSDPPAVSVAGSAVSDCGAAVWLAEPSLTAVFVAMLPIAPCSGTSSGTNCSVTTPPVATISVLAISVTTVPVATVPVAGWEAAFKGRPDPNRAMTPRPKPKTSDLLWESPGAVGSSGEPVVNRLRGTTGSPGVAERG